MLKFLKNLALAFGLQQCDTYTSENMGDCLRNVKIAGSRWYFLMMKNLLMLLATN